MSEESAIAVPVPKEILATSEESAIAVPVPKEILATSEESAIAVPVSKEILATSEEYAVAVAVPKEILATSTVLRPYQQECLNECLDKFEQGITRQIVSLPVGSGKTVILSHLIQALTKNREKGKGRILVCAHREELLYQASSQIKLYCPDLIVDLEKGRHHADSNADVVIASVPTLGRSGSERINRFNPETFKCIIIDEAHHAAASSYRRILEYFGATGPGEGPFVWGCSATVRRHDGVRLDRVFDHITYHKNFLQMITEGWLCNLRVTTVRTTVDISKVKVLQGDFQASALANCVNTTERNEIVVRSYARYAADRQSTVVFAVDVAHVKDLEAMFREYGYDARYLTAKTHATDRADLLTAFRAREFPILINCGILTEGTDIPVIDCVLLARPTRSSSLLQQMIGRGMRLSPGKDHCLALDFVDSLRRRGLCTVPTLMGLSEADTFAGEDVTKPREGTEPEDKYSSVHNADEMDQSFSFGPDGEEPSSPPPPSFSTSQSRTDEIYHIKTTEYDNPFLLQGDCSGADNLREHSPYNWVRVRRDLFLLDARGFSIVLERVPDTELFTVKSRSRLSHVSATDPTRGKGFTRYTPLVDGAHSFLEALHFANKYIERKYGRSSSAILDWNASWRSRPMTDAQRTFLEEKNFDLSTTLTQGQAGNLITRSIHGGLLYWKSIEAERVKKEKAEKKIECGREAIRVTTGPI